MNEEVTLKNETTRKNEEEDAEQLNRRRTQVARTPVENGCLAKL